MQKFQKIPLILQYFANLCQISLNITKFNSALGGILYSTISTIYIPLCLGLPLLPYILYLLVNKNSLWFDTKKELKEALLSIKIEDSDILIKGSRSLELEKLLPVIKKISA